MGYLKQATMGVLMLAGLAGVGYLQKAHAVDNTQGIEQKVDVDADMLWQLAGYAGMVCVAGMALSGFRTVRQTERGLVERFGKYKRLADPGLTYIMPMGIERVRKVNITEMMVNAQPQEIITKDNLNARVDAQVYFKVRPDEDNVKKSQYNVNEYHTQIVQLARTTLRNIIGNLTLKEANSDRNKINNALMETLQKETSNWGIDVVRAELKEIDPPQDVQETMNKVVKAQNEKEAAVDFATALETKADGEKRAAIKSAQGKKEAAILEAQGAAEAIKVNADAQAEAIKKVNQAVEEYFKGSAIDYKRMEVTQRALEQNAKVVFVPEGSNLVNIVTDSNVPIVPVQKT
ncbi:MAG: SPFH domain-containing protein [archaeon]